MKLRKTNSHTVRTYDKILNLEQCQGLISAFEGMSEYHETVKNDGRPNFTQLNVNSHHVQAINYLVDRVKTCLEIYQSDLLGLTRHMPPIKSLESFRVKKYVPGGDDRFDEHVDVGDYPSARRYLAMLFYLNDVEEGGETVFPFHDMMVRPKTGSVLVFPPTWEYPHAGRPPISGPKYIMSTYLHYG